MKSVIKDIYYGNTTIAKIKSSVNEKDNLLFDRLHKELTKENIKLVNSLIDNIMERMAIEEFEIYKLGFKTGFSLAIEILDKEDI